MHESFNNYFILSIIANLFQVLDFSMNMSQLSNDDIMKELQNQDKILSGQINMYLKKIIKQNDEIISLLKEQK